MKVSERISKIWAVVDDTDVYPPEVNAIIKRQLLQLEAEIAEALQVTTQEGYQAGFDDGRQEGYKAGYDDGGLAAHAGL